MKLKLLFVYNADGGLFSKVTDFAHKILSPSTYPCILCTLTFDNFGMKKEWAEVLKKLNIETAFFHKDEFQKKYRKYTVELPAIFIDHEVSPQVLVPHAMIEACITLEDLEEVITAKLKSITDINAKHKTQI